jgi:hypothetical protein
MTARASRGRRAGPKFAAMRTSLAALLTLVVTSAAVAADRVVVAAPILNVVNNATRLREVCPADGEFDACTRFIAFRLTASCSVRDGRQWSMDASATFTPWIVAWHLSSIPHEHLHIGDIHESAERYIDALMQQSFVSKMACESEALAAANTFEGSMRTFARLSNEKRHHAILRASR